MAGLGGGPWTKQIALPNDFVLVAATTVGSEVVLNERCRGLLVGTAGSLNVTMRNGSVRTGVPFLAGVNPGQFASVQAGGDAENIWQVI